MKIIVFIIIIVLVIYIIVKEIINISNRIKYRKSIRVGDIVKYSQHSRTTAKAKILNIEGNKITISTEVSIGEIYP